MFVRRNTQGWKKSLVTMLALIMTVSLALPALAFGETQAPAWESDAVVTTSDVTGGSFNLSWTAATGAESYKVVVSNSIGGETTNAVDTITTDTTYAVSGLTNNRRYDIKVTATNSAGDSSSSLTNLVVTTPGVPLMASPNGVPGFYPTTITDSNYRYKFQPNATKDTGRSNTFETVFVYNNLVDPALTAFEWYMQGGFNGALASLKTNIKSFRLFNLTDGNEIALNYGSDSDFPAAPNPNNWATGTYFTTGDFTLTKSNPYSVMFTFRLNIAKYLEAGKEYAVTIDPQCNTGGANPTYLSQVYSFEFTTLMAAPILQSAEVSGTELTLTYDNALDETSVPAPADFTVHSGSGTIGVSNVAISGSAVTLTLATPVTYDNAVTLDYVKGTNPVRDAAGNDLTGFSGQAVSNNTPTPKYTVTADSDPSYDNGLTPDGITVMTVKSGVTGLKYFSVSVSPVIPHGGNEVVVFVLLRGGMQQTLSATKADFDVVSNAKAGFNVQSGDVVKSYIVDDLTNSLDHNPIIFQ